MTKASPKKCNSRAQSGLPSNSKRKPDKLPPDPDGLFKRAAARAKKVIAMYDDLNLEVERDDLITDLIHDLMHLCDRDPELGEFDEKCGRAFNIYDGLVKESKWMVGTLSYEEAFGRKPPR